MNRAHSDHRGSIPARSGGESTSRLRNSGPFQLGRTCVFIIGCCLLTTSVGCMRLPIRHGMIVKGDWSLEMNRIPWMKGRGDAYQQPSDAGAVQGVCVAEIDSPFVSGVPRLAAGAQSCDHGCGSAVQGPPAGYHNHPRFHPVPTQSVFGPGAGVAPDTGVQTSPAVLPPVRKMPKSLEPPPMPPETENIPTPAPSPPVSPNDQTASRRNPGNQQASWIFSPATDSGGSGPNDAQRYAAGRVARVAR